MDHKTLDLAVDGQNVGWGAPNLTATVVAWSGQQREMHVRDLGQLELLGQSRLQEQISLARNPNRVDVELDRGSGRQFYIVWDKAAKPPPPVLGNRFFRSSGGLMIAVAVLWVVVPMLVSQVRAGRRRDVD